MGIYGKYLPCSIHNMQMLFCCELKINSEYLLPLHKHVNGRFSGEGSAQTHRHGGAFAGSYPHIFFLTPQILLCSEKFVLNIKMKIFPPKNVFCSHKP